ncbi:hypothetical protein BgiMline_004479 [Biomphalaria glabrata]|uniref:Uncharacterized protein LOC106069364 isoform X1 n=2 Tax=Biomphalaria glabrata TaxID=6526 RepID=A0A9W2ZR90_BIOGL|nr:uncharacterized protein LOC106069364 isoform X1 [Biomphalaria glabrata]XP_055877391.1 uncharacterized protein LOC106069364 isoform X1 [Biomphalaria glabrata]XP_055877392.1 uncharacterized protein LOC106069364 isoform X1 [Biomphalaria glabrata]XP_055877393.1 uncharacterized protein LOC106069364 isoform X1 [Biomphalaria glabrata]KAI8796848.1 hypothetical protein BgiBS90_002025 [Biomphalaria glabrata]
MTCMQATVSPMMQTVIRWRRASEIESSRYPAASNPCSYLLGNSLCYIISGCLLLVVGVIITSLTFQNLDGTSSENKERYAGPVLIAAGVLVMARGALSRLWPRRRTMSARRRSLLRRYIREIYSRPIFAVSPDWECLTVRLPNNSTFSLCDMEVADLYHVSSRTRLYSDDPPSYEVVTSGQYVYRDTYVHAYSNPANEVEDDYNEEDLDTQDHPIRIIVTQTSDVATPNEDPSPPPSYDEYIQSETMKTTTL